MSGVLLAATALSSACALEPGQAWGELKLDVAVSTEVPASRVDADGLLRTSNDFRVALDSFSGSIGTVAVTPRGDASSVSFDPASPPPGYSLCHAGHCHADSGELVPYEEIAAELGGGGAPASIEFRYEQPYSLGTNTRLALPAACPTPMGVACELPRGAIADLRVTMQDLRVRGIAYDSRTGASARIGTDGVAFDITVPGPIEVRAPYVVRIDRGAEFVIRADATLGLGAEAFDGVDWALDEPELFASVSESIAVSIGLNVLPAP